MNLISNAICSQGGPASVGIWALRGCEVIRLARKIPRHAGRVPFRALPSREDRPVPQDTTSSPGYASLNKDSLPGVAAQSAAERRGNNCKVIKDFRTENGSSRGQNLALTVL